MVAAAPTAVDFPNAMMNVAAYLLYSYSTHLSLRVGFRGINNNIVIIYIYIYIPKHTVHSLKFFVNTTSASKVSFTNNKKVQ